MYSQGDGYRGPPDRPFFRPRLEAGERTYGQFGTMAGRERYGPRPRRRQNFSARELREFEQMQPRKQVITDFDTPENLDDAPVSSMRVNPFGVEAPVHETQEREMGWRKRPPTQESNEEPYLLPAKDFLLDVEPLSKTRDRPPRDLRERLAFAHDRRAELAKRRRLLQQCRELEEAIVFHTAADGEVTIDEDYPSHVEAAYEAAKSFE
eukprot:RCo051809